jgi:hypothetical protein
LNTSLEKQLLPTIAKGLSEKIVNFWQKLDGLDWDLISKNLISSHTQHQWTAEKLQSAINLYKMFLCLHFLFPDIELAPTPEIDRLWHTHILLNTAKYIHDCQQLYGYTLHHYSAVGDKLEMIPQHQQLAFDVTKTLFAEIFGVDILQNCGSHWGDCLTLPQQLPNLQTSACLTIPKC